MKTYNIIGGVNGAGKSSLTGVLLAERNLGTVIDIDKLSKRKGLTNIEAGREAIATIESLIDNGDTFTQETTLSGSRTLNTVRKAKAAGYRICLFYVGLDDIKEHFARIANRVSKGGHDIAVEDVTRRFEGRFDTLPKVMTLCDEVSLYDNDNGFTKVGEYKNGQLFVLSSAPKWLKELESMI